MLSESKYNAFIYPFCVTFAIYKALTSQENNEKKRFCLNFHCYQNQEYHANVVFKHRRCEKTVFFLLKYMFILTRSILAIIILFDFI